MPKAQNFFTPAEEDRIVQTIKDSEKRTSGEIRVHLDDSIEGDEWETAQKVFLELRMNETALRNGILFHIAVREKTFSIVADVGINEAVPDDFWDNIKNQMQSDFKEGKFADGLCNGIEAAGKALKEYFPFDAGTDENELSDEISY